METGSGQEPSKWGGEEARTLLRVQFGEDLAEGIYESYNHYAKYYYSASTQENASILLAKLNAIAKSEISLVVLVENDSDSTMPDVDNYYLAKFNPNTGQEVRTEEGESAVFVASINRAGLIIKQSAYFTRTQVELVYEHAQQLKAAGLQVRQAL